MIEHDVAVKTRRPFPWLESLLALAVVVLVLQLFPAWGGAVLAVVNPLNWGRIGWIVANALVVVGLLAMRFGPGMADDWRARRIRIAKEREQQAHQRELKEQREALERMKQAKRRRIY